MVVSLGRDFTELLKLLFSNPVSVKLFKGNFLIYCKFPKVTTSL